MLVQPSANTRSVKAPIRLNPVNICFMTFPFFCLVVWSAFDFSVSYSWFGWLLLAVGFAYSALAEIVPENGGWSLRSAPPRLPTTLVLLPQPVLTAPPCVR